MSRRSTRGSGDLVRTLLLGVLTGCAHPGDSSSWSRSRVAGAAVRTGSSAVSMAACSGSSCRVTLAGIGSRAHVLGATISLDQARDGRATLRVDGSTVSCTAGRSVAAGRLRLACTDVGDDRVELSVSAL